MCKSLVNKLQLCQNHAARIVSLRRQFDHITPVMMALHWLLVHERIQSKILLPTYKALHGLAPPYIKDLVVPYVPPRPLRSGDQHLLETPTHRLQTFGYRSFALAAPTLWNPLPLAVKSSPSLDIFKTRLKTHLFVQAYSM